ncbi:hypothetical protein ABZZ17_14755 [Streptomyces sp. NPDC006512]|uniref:hypothetical protein n=1 Tax=Streptomyces sp. NPDC006512 TaxID=3154307 RepID=UPI0033BCD44F
MSRRAVWEALFGARPAEPRPGPDAAEPLDLTKITATLGRNMDRLDGDFGAEAIRTLGNPVPMLVENSGTELLELWLEPFGQDYWLRPGEAFLVTSYGSWDDRPFEIAHEPDRIQIWASSCFATVTFRDGTEVPGGHQRPREEY